MGVPTLWIVGGVVWCLLPMLLVGLLWFRSTETVRVSGTATWVPINANTAPIDRNVDLSIIWQPAVNIYSPLWSGVVTKTSITAGATVDSGDVALSINSIDRLALHTKQPFSRVLDRGSSGADVVMLNQTLSSMGFPANKDSDKFTWTTVQSVRKLAASLGVPGATDIDAFDPSWFVYLPLPSVVVEESNASVGALAPAPGSALFVAIGRMASAQLVEHSESARSIEDPSPTQSGTTEGGTQISEAPVATASPDEQLAVAGTIIPLADDRMHVAEIALPILEGLVERGAQRVSGVLRSDPDGSSWVVPSAAVIQDSASMCVVVKGPTPDESSVVAIEVVGSRIGVSIVKGALSTSSQVLVAPTQRLRQCPSG